MHLKYADFIGALINITTKPVNRLDETAVSVMTSAYINSFQDNIPIKKKILI